MTIPLVVRAVRYQLYGAGIVFLAALLALAGMNSLAQPVAPAEPHFSTHHGDTRRDDYHWLRQKGSRAVTAYLEAENAYAHTVMAQTSTLREGLYREMLARIQETDREVPYADGGYFYYSRTEQGLQYPIYCRRKGSLEAAEEVLLDLNRLAKGRDYLALGALEVSPNGRLLAYTLDRSGFRNYTLSIKDLATGRLLRDRQHRVRSFAWANDNRHLFVVTEDAAKRAYRLQRHKLGVRQTQVVYTETDALFSLAVYRSRSGGFLFLAADSATSSEVRYLAADTPLGSWRVLEPRRRQHEYAVGHRGGEFFIRSNDRGRNFRLVTAPIASPGSAHWEELIPARDEVMLEDVDLFQDHLVAIERSGGFRRLRVYDFAAKSFRSISFSEPAYAVYPTHNLEFAARRYRFVYQSFVTPESVVDYDFASGEQVVLKREPVLGGYEAANYRSELLYAPAQDGEMIPVSLVYRSDLRDRVPMPLLLEGYGAYGFPNPVGFDSTRLSLLERGVAFAIAHVRGGGEMGKRWHESGRMLEKQNTFSDFIAAAEHLIRLGYTAPDRLAAVGGSAGGLLVGAVLNQRPDLFRVALLQVPFVDALNTMLDASLPLTIGEYEEWGNPNEPRDYAAIKAYSPYDNLRAQAYPAMLVETSINDSQVMYWEPAKYVARLRRLKTDAHPLLLKTHMAAGHGGASGRYDSLRELAYTYAFLLWQLGRH